MSNFTHPAKLVWCPNNCTFNGVREPKKLKVTKSKDNIFVTKSCPYCKFKIKYARTDTAEGRKHRADNYYKENIRPKLPIAKRDPNEVRVPLTPAERMRNMRARRREAEREETGVIVPPVS